MDRRTGEGVTVQTFLPYPNFVVSAMHLDYRRLGKQRVEARQILRAISVGGAWSNHPAATMWRGCETALEVYGDVMIREWMRRGYNNSMPILWDVIPDCRMPSWLGDPEFHATHRSRLLLKDPVWYGQFGWTEEPGREYIWPGETK